MDTRTAVHIAYPGSLPHVATIDTDHCLRFLGESCRACKDACAFDAVDFEAAAEHRELAVGAVVVAIGFQGFDPGRSDRYGYGSVDNVITAFAFERLVNTAGPTGGRILLADGSTPDSVAIVHCVGSRTESFNRFCSGVCCTTAAKHARQVNRQLPEAEIHHLFADLCLPGKTAQHFFNVVTETTGASLHRLAHPDAVRIVAGDDGATLDYTDVSGKVRRVKAQLVVLATAMEPAADMQHLAGVADLACDDDGFICETHAVMDPVAATRDGIYVAGCCQGPRDIPASIAHGQAAAGRILQTLVPGEKIALEPLIAQVDPDLCSGCRTCKPLCPFGALEWDADGAVMAVVDTLCRGCGICAAGCPGGAVAVYHYSPEAVGAEISAVLDSGEV
jgi:heterodisulfide reductase subunit A